MDSKALILADRWRAVPEEFGAIADHFRLPWRFHARVVAGREPLRV